MTIFRRPDPIPIPRPFQPLPLSQAREGGQSLQARAAKRIFFQILHEQFADAGVLPSEASYCEQFNVSRTVVREAIKSLEAKNVLRARRKSGTLILPKDQWSALDRDLLTWRLEAGDSRLLGDIDAALLKMVNAAFGSPVTQQFDPEQVNLLRNLLQDNDFAAAAKVYFDLVASAFDNTFDIAMVKTLAHVRISCFGVRNFSVEQFTSAPQISVEAIRALGKTFLGQHEALPSIGAINRMP